MKIYFDGCSWTEGAELSNPEEERYSKLICNKMGAEETNLAKGGGSNDRIVRNLLVENNIEDYNLAIIQMTHPSRTEFLKGLNRWMKVLPNQNYNKWLYSESEKEKKELYEEHGVDSWETGDGHPKFWRHYYTNVANLKYFNIKENIQKQTICNHCKVKGVPLILCSINARSKLHFDYLMRVTSETKAKRGHPNVVGHQKIAEDIMKLVPWGVF